MKGFTRILNRTDHVPLLPDHLLFSEDEVQKLVAERDETLRIELCEFPEHQKINEWLKAENDVLKQQLSYEKAKSAAIAGELSRFKALAGRVLDGDKIEDGWNSAHKAFVGLIGGLLGWRDEQENVNQ